MYQINFCERENRLPNTNSHYVRQTFTAVLLNSPDLLRTRYTDHLYEIKTFIKLTVDVT